MKRVSWIVIFAVFGLVIPACADESGGEGGSDAAITDDAGDTSGADAGADADDAGDADQVDVDLGPCPEGAFANVGADSVESATYYVATDGDDANDGTSPQTAFATIQKGVDALEPGDTLSIAPGDYYGSVRREGIGADGETTTIRAQIPGTAVLRGDVAAPVFQKLDGFDFVYVADYDFGADEEIQVINERDTLSVLEHMPSIAELEYTPGTFHQDRDAGKLYISSTDRRPPAEHHYTLSNIGTHGLYLGDAAGVVIDGLSVTGFNTAGMIDHRDHTLRSVWGVFLENSHDSVVRNTDAFLNARGIGTWSADESAGGNVIESCAARANISQYGIGDTGGITLIEPRHDTVRDSQSFLNSDYGINIRGGGQSGQDMANQSFLSRSITWGNGLWDTRIKTGYSHVHVADHLVAPGDTMNPLNPDHCVFGTTVSDHGDDTIVFDEEPAELDRRAEFADPDNFDYRLQATSRFRGAAADGSDRGAYAYEANIFYVGPDGDDANDGLSVQNAFATLGHALDQLGAGQTLYVLPGIYEEDVDLSLAAEADNPAVVKGRGTQPAIIKGEVHIADSAHLRFERLVFAGPVSATNSSAVTFANNRFGAATVGLQATGLEGLRVSHSTFANFAQAAVAAEGSTALFLANNIYDNARGVAVRLDTTDALLYSNYNSYRSVARAFQVDQGMCSVADAAGRAGAQSRQIVPQFSDEGDLATLQNPKDFGGRALDARALGTYRDRIPHQKFRLDKELHVHSVSATTANLEWMTNLPAAAEVAWGETEQVQNQGQIEANRFASYSLTGLQPDTTYYFKLRSLRIPDEVDVDANPVDLSDQMVSFTTLPQDDAPKTYYVAPDGDDADTGADWDHAFRTVQQSANVVNVGDTVMIAEGSYFERVRVRATGTQSKPITFRAAPGARVVFDGDEQALNQALVVGQKSYLHFDGLQFRGFNFSLGGTGSWRPAMGGEFNLYQADHITISRCLSDGRGGASTARTVVSEFSPYLHMTNCVSVNKMSNALYLVDSPHSLVEHTVFMRPLIGAFLVRRSAPEATFRNNIFTDSLKKKADANIALLGADGDTDQLVIDDNTFQLRSFGPDQRNLLWGQTAAELSVVTNPLFADPQFQGSLDLEAAGVGPYDFWPDRLTWSDVDYDFDTFMPTNPQVISAGHGLEPDQFDNGLPN